MYTYIHSNIIHNNQKLEATQLFMVDEWISEMWPVHTTEYPYSRIQRKDVLTQATTWMNLEDIMLREISQTKGAERYVSTYVRDLGAARFSRMVVPGVGGGDWGVSV